MQDAKCKMQNEASSESVGTNIACPQPAEFTRDQGSRIKDQGVAPVCAATEPAGARRDGTLPSAFPAGAATGRPQPAETSPACHSEQSEESVSPVSPSLLLKGKGEGCAAAEARVDDGAPQTMALIARAQAGDKAALEQLLTENTGLIRAVARRYWGRGVEAEDLFQLGSLGFLKAVAGFDLGFGTRFSTYAVPKIAGEIRRFLRDDGTVKVSRTLKERAVAIHQARDRLGETLGREPVLSELAEALDLTAEEIAEAETAADPVASIQQPAGEGGLTLEAVLSDSPMEERLVERLALHQALDRLPERDAKVIALRYFHGLTQERTARIIGVSQVQVSRIEKKALAHLRELLE